MAKTNRTRKTSFEGLDHDQLRRELGFDDLTYEECFRELFGDLLDVPPRAAAGPVRVTQMGPGRRSGPRPRPETEEK
jgi:hypothetical protein